MVVFLPLLLLLLLSGQLVQTSSHPHPDSCRLVQTAALCNHGQLSSVPLGLPGFIEELHLNHNHIQTLQNGPSYPALHTLSCPDNQLETVGSKFFSHTPLIEHLNFAVNNLHVGYQETSRALTTLSQLRVLDLSDNGLTEDMASVLLQNLTRVEHLNLSRNLLLRLDERSFRDMHQLRELDLQRNSLFEIDGGFLHMRRLQRLNLAFNYLPCLLNFQMVQLLVLNVSHNSLEWFISNQDLEETFQLETLDLSDNRLLFFPFLPTRSHLRNLHLSRNRLSFYEHLDSNATSNWTTSIHFYNLGGNLSGVMARLWSDDLHGDISSLELLDLSWNQVSYLPHGFVGSMPILTRLKMGTNCLEVLDLSREQLPGSLYELDLSNNLLTDLRASGGSVGELGNLTYLNLSQNSLQRLPSWWFSSLPSLVSVDLSSNPVGVCPSGHQDDSSCVVWRNIPSLKQLQLAGCHLGTLPDSAFSGTPLTHLELSNNPELIIQPTALQGLSRTLQHLGLGNTGLRDFDFSHFHHLKSLNLSGNSLTRLPDSLLSLQLTCLDLRNNRLSSLTASQASSLASSLQTVLLNGNPFNCCRLDWYWTFERTEALRMVDSWDVTCQDFDEQTHRVQLLSSPSCESEGEESVFWYVLLFLSVALSLVGISALCLLTFRPRTLPRAIKKKCWRPTPY
ncbi:transforming growth factor beta activator LRRC33 [Osmerus eperlanus]|uniref:transforming growth factor beta activator LRRC33 n=1 Tax=Osmerus eperlanus TaxID=29151 RepID=UPI002E12037C